METHVVAPAPERRTSIRAGIAGTVLFAAIFALALDWAKWTPYLHKLHTIDATRTWPGHDLLAQAGPAHGSPSLHGAWAFTTAYVDAVWPAVVAGLLIAAGVEALLPRGWLLATLRRRTDARSSVAGGLLALPSLMCTCCAAPLAATLRRSGAPTSAVLAYWLGNPVLNPAVLVFLALVAPWQWVATRLVAGCVLVFGVSVVVAAVADRRRQRAELVLEEVPPLRLAEAPRRYVAALTRLAATLLPEYAVVVFLLGLVRGWLFPFDGSAAHWGILAVLVAAVLGTLVVLPTGGEIPIVQGLAAAGVATGVQGALLITLPAISLASMAMVARTLSPRVTVAAAAGVVVTGLGAAALLAALT